MQQERSEVIQWSGVPGIDGNIACYLARCAGSRLAVSFSEPQGSWFFSVFRWGGEFDEEGYPLTEGACSETEQAPRPVVSLAEAQADAEAAAEYWAASGENPRAYLEAGRFVPPPSSEGDPMIDPSKTEA